MVPEMFAILRVIEFSCVEAAFVAGYIVPVIAGVCVVWFNAPDVVAAYRAAFNSVAAVPFIYDSVEKRTGSCPQIGRGLGVIT